MWLPLFPPAATADGLVWNRVGRARYWGNTHVSHHASHEFSFHIPCRDSLLHSSDPFQVLPAAILVACCDWDDAVCLGLVTLVVLARASSRACHNSMLSCTGEVLAPLSGTIHGQLLKPEH